MDLETEWITTVVEKTGLVGSFTVKIISAFLLTSNKFNRNGVKFYENGYRQNSRNY